MATSIPRVVIPDLDPTFPTDSVIPFVCAGFVFPLLILSLYWVHLSFFEWQRNGNGWFGAQSLQFFAWCLVALDLILLSAGFVTYTSCPTPYLYKLGSAENCPTRYLVNTSTFVRYISSAVLTSSIMLRFQPTYKAFGSPLLLNVHRYFLWIIIVSTLVSITMFLGPVFNRNVNEVSGFIAFCRKLRVPAYVVHLILLSSLALISAWYGTRFILQRFQRLHREMSLTQGSLHQVYFCLLFTALLACTFVALQVVCLAHPNTVSDVVRLTANTLILTLGLVGYMQALNAINVLLTRCCRLGMSENKETSPSSVNSMNKV
jgi:hypothetical protein